MNRYKKPVKNNIKSNPCPRSELQKIQSESNWAIHFKLQPFSQYNLRHLAISATTTYYIRMYNAAVRLLIKSIKKDTETTKQSFIEKKKKLLDIS